MAKLPALPHVRSGVSQGKSANQSYRDYQATAKANGLRGMRRQDYLRLHSQTLAARARTAAAIRAPKTDLPSGEMISPRSTTKARGYGSWVMIYQRTKGETDLIETPWLIRSEELITPEEAERRAGNYIAQNPYEYDRVVLGIGYVGTDAYSPDL